MMTKLGKKHSRSFEVKKSMYGVGFISLWLVGIIMFFLIPMIKSIWYVFCDVGFALEGGITTDFTGLNNLDQIFTVDPDYVTNLGDAISSFVFSFPVIIILSLVFAIILNQKFHGRIFVRAIFFLPVIIATGVVMQMMNASVAGQPNFQEVGSAGAYAGNLIDFNKVLSNLDFPTAITDVLSDYVNKVFNIIWKTGVQVLLFVSGMQTIPDQLYEVSKIEGATKWEEFWFVTIPMMKNIILLVMMYTMVDLFVTVDSPVVSQAFGLISSMAYGLSSAMLWAYILIAMAIGGIVLGIYYKCCMKRW